MFYSCINTVAALLVSVMNERDMHPSFFSHIFYGETESLGPLSRFQMQRPDERLKFSLKASEPIEGSF